MNSKKSFILVLHSHIPYVLGHGTWPHGTDWLYEAAAESYVPLLDVFTRLVQEGCSPQVNLGITPVLAEQLASPLFVSGFGDYLDMKTGAARRDKAYFERTCQAELVPLAQFWEEWYRRIAAIVFEQNNGDLLGAFKSLQDQEHIEILTSAATHGYFPLLSTDESIRWQILQGRLTYRRHFGRDPLGFWLPECAYRPGYAWASPLHPQEPVARRGVDELLQEQGLGCFFIAPHLLLGGQARGVYEERFPALKFLWEQAHKEGEAQGPHPDRSPYRPYRAHPSGVPFFARDEVSGQQVWSRFMGYPGDGWYLEFHKKHFPGGLRYWRITSSQADLADKGCYDPAKVQDRLEEHAGHFVALVRDTLLADDRSVIASLYDTELFGHWWFEGPEWLYLVLKKLNSGPVPSSTVRRALDEHAPRDLIALPEGSWGEGGFHSVWLNKDTSWIWDRIHDIEARVLSLLRSNRQVQKRRLLKQLMREKFLLESSDWPFLVSTWTARDYAENRAAEHYRRASALCDWIESPAELGPVEEAQLAAWEQEDGLFQDVVMPDEPMT